MGLRTGQISPMMALIINDVFGTATAVGRALSDLANELRALGVKFVISVTLDDRRTVIASDPSIECVLLD